MEGLSVYLPMWEQSLCVLAAFEHHSVSQTLRSITLRYHPERSDQPETRAVQCHEPTLLY